MKIYFLKLKTFAVLTILTIAIFGANAASAATETGVFSFEKAFAQEEKNNPIDLETRIKILNNVIDTAQTETESLKTKLNSLNLTEQWLDIKNEFIKDIDELKTYYSEFKTKINEKDLTLDNVKILAKELKEQREQNYTSELKKITNMILIFEDENLLKIVRSRLDKISADIKKLDRQNIIKTNTLKTQLNQANKLYKNAEKLKEDAKNLFSKAVDQTIAVEKEIDSEQKTKPQEEIQNSVRGLITESIKEIKAIYDTFFQMNEKMKNL